MQRTIDRVGRLHVTGGTVMLRMSVGIGTGTYHFFMIGSVHRELLIAGPAMTETLAHGGDRRRGRDRPQPGPRRRGCDPALLGRAKEGVTLLSAPPDVAAQRAPDVGDVSEDRHRLVHPGRRAGPRPARAQRAGAPDDHGRLHRHDGHRRLLAEIGPEELGRGLDERIRSIQEAALRYEVPFYETDIGKSSVKALLTAGAPSSTGHDEERMLRALREIMDGPGLVPMRVGVNTGKVFTGDFGPPYRRAYRVFGDAINTAARVMSKAASPARSWPPRSSSTGRERSSRPRRSSRSRRRARPTPSGVDRRGRSGEGVAPHRLALVGREAELRVLQRVDGARGPGRDRRDRRRPGVGKTRSSTERSPVARLPPSHALRGVRVLDAVLPDAGSRPRDRRGDTAADPDEVEDPGAAVERRDPDSCPGCRCSASCSGSTCRTRPRPRPSTSGSCATGWPRSPSASRACSTAPAMLVIEDIHHMDEATGDLLARLSGRGGSRR